MPASQHTSVGLTPYSVSTFTSMEAKPKIALVGTPREVAIDSGSAKKARYTRLGQSFRNTRVRCAGASAAPALARVASLAIDSSLYAERVGGARRCRAAAPR